MSNILAVYNALAAADVTIPSTSQVIQAWTLEEIPNSIAAADLPHRLVMPFRANQPEAGKFVTMGTSIAQVDWQVSEWMLLAPCTQGTGIAQFAPVLIDYIGGYIEMLRGIYRPTSQQQHATLTSWDMKPSIIEYPLMSGTLYFGVVCEMVFRENLTAAVMGG